MSMELNITRSVILPIKTFQRVIKFAEQKGIVRGGGDANFSRAMAVLADIGLEAASDGEQEETHERQT